MPMNIGKAVEEAVERFRQADYDSGLVFLCIAVSATSNKEYPHVNRDSEKFKNFVRDNMDLIMLLGMGVNFLGAKQGKHFKIKQIDASIRNPKFPGYATLEEVFYHVVRCNLMHEAKVGDMVKFVPGNAMTLSKDTLKLPEGFLMGLLLSVVGAGSNSGERTEKRCTVANQGTGVDINSLWGDKETIMKMAKGTSRPN